MKRRMRILARLFFLSSYADKILKFPNSKINNNTNSNNSNSNLINSDRPFSLFIGHTIGQKNKIIRNDKPLKVPQKSCGQFLGVLFLRSWKLKPRLKLFKNGALASLQNISTLKIKAKETDKSASEKELVNTSADPIFWPEKWEIRQDCLCTRRDHKYTEALLAINNTERRWRSEVWGQWELMDGRPLIGEWFSIVRSSGEIRSRQSDATVPFRIVFFFNFINRPTFSKCWKYLLKMCAHLLISH